MNASTNKIKRFHFNVTLINNKVWNSTNTDTVAETKQSNLDLVYVHKYTYSTVIAMLQSVLYLFIVYESMLNGKQYDKIPIDPAAMCRGVSWFTFLALTL